MTLDVPQKLLRYTHSNKSPVNTAKKDRRGHNTPQNKTAPEQLKVMDKFIRCLPAVSSLYCRNKSNKKYLLSEFRNIANLYLIYKDYCKKKMNFLFHLQFFGVFLRLNILLASIYLRKTNVGFVKKK